MSEIESNDNDLPMIERAIQGKKSGRANMVVPPHIRLKDQSEGKDQALESLKAWQDLQREKELEKELERLDAELAALKK
jgi:hypothetical protein